MSAEAVLTQWALGGSRASPTLQVVQRPYFATGTQCRACIPPSQESLVFHVGGGDISTPGHMSKQKIIDIITVRNLETT